MSESTDKRETIYSIAVWGVLSASGHNECLWHQKSEITFGPHEENYL